jgi:hypothetical protein
MHTQGLHTAAFFHDVALVAPYAAKFASYLSDRQCNLPTS